MVILDITGHIPILSVRESNLSSFLFCTQHFNFFWIISFEIENIIWFLKDSSSEEEAGDLETKLREKALQSMKKSHKGHRDEEDSEEDSGSSD